MTEELNEELNKKLAEWAEFTQDREFKDWWQDPNGRWIIPNFTESLDACFKWLVPKLDNYRIASYDDGRVYISVTYKDKIWYSSNEGKPTDTAPALCLAINNLIEQIDKEE